VKIYDHESGYFKDWNKTDFHLTNLLDNRFVSFEVAAILCRAQTYHCTIFRQNRSFHCGDIVFFSIFMVAAAAILDFWNREILLVILVQSVETHQHAKFRQNRSVGCKDIKIFRFFKIAAVAILDFRNRELLFADDIWRAHTHHCTKYCRNRSLFCGDIAIFRIFKMAAAAILDFWNREILLVTGVQRVETHQHAKFCQNRSIGCEDIKFFSIFQDGGRPPSWICLGHIWTTHSKYFSVSITMESLVMIDAVVFIIWTFQYLARLAGKSLLTPQKL